MLPAVGFVCNIPPVVVELIAFVVDVVVAVERKR
jgi:hypothetical protein